jgi:hypothetical protein
VDLWRYCDYGSLGTMGYCNSLKTIWTIWLSFGLNRVHLPAHHNPNAHPYYWDWYLGSMGDIGVGVSCVRPWAYHTGVLGL